MLPQAESARNAGHRVSPVKSVAASTACRPRTVLPTSRRSTPNSVRPEVDPQRIGLWGTSYGGAIVVYTATFD
jgi:hypothetical protein